MNPTHILTSYLFKINYNIILLPTPRPLKWLIPVLGQNILLSNLFQTPSTYVLPLGRETKFKPIQSKGNIGKEFYVRPIKS
jgi:hypothetical protein